MKKPVISNVMEPRWPAALAIIGALILLLILPGRIRILPFKISFIVAIAAIFPLAAVTLTSGSTFWLKVERFVTLLIFTMTLVVNCGNLGKLITLMLRRSVELSGLQLLASGLGVWIINFLSFSLMYWMIDRGGPGGRSNNISTRPDWQFPNENSPANDKEHGWKPVYVDYMFLSFCTATAFSPTDALPLTGRAKLLIMLQSTISLVTLAVVLSRAVNILGN